MVHGQVHLLYMSDFYDTLSVLFKVAYYSFDGV